MKKHFLFLITLFFCLQIFSQADYSGSYGYSLKPASSPSGGEQNAGPSGNLVLLKMDANKYRFWLDVIIGPPSYDRGETDGTITFINDTASFDNTFENATNSCILKFKISGNIITISSLSSSFNCGFGNGVNANGDYTKLKTQPLLNNEWLKKQYPASPMILVIVAKAEVFKDENGLYPKNYFFKKGDLLLNVTETEKTIYTEYITPEGNFIYGWIKKSSLIKNE